MTIRSVRVGTLALHHAARPAGPVLVDSRPFAPFGWKLRARLKLGVRNLRLSRPQRRRILRLNTYGRQFGKLMKTLLELDSRTKALEELAPHELVARPSASRATS